jgi:hypothetical protein
MSELNPDRCNQEIFDHGEHVFTIGDVSAQWINKWVSLVAAKSGQKVDWFYIGGRAAVMAMGDINRVRSACALLLHLVIEETEYWRFTTDCDIPLRALKDD